MSDERDGAGSTGAGTGPGADSTGTGASTGHGRGQTAVASRPLRPTGKRARRGAVELVEPTTDEAAAQTDGDDSVSKNGPATKTRTKTAKDSDPDKTRRNPFLFVVNYLKQVVAELRKVIWPNRKQMVNYTIVVLVFLAFMVALIAGTDYGLARLISLVFGN